jgi:ankyrin repeat protein
MSIHFACYYGHYEVLNELLSRGANPNKETHDGWTALLIAGYQGKAECKI